MRGVNNQGGMPHIIKQSRNKRLLKVPSFLTVKWGRGQCWRKCRGLRQYILKERYLSGKMKIKVVRRWISLGKHIKSSKNHRMNHYKNSRCGVLFPRRRLPTTTDRFLSRSRPRRRRKHLKRWGRKVSLITKRT